MFIYLLFNIVQSQNWIQYSFAFPQLVPLVAEKTVFSRNLSEFGQILNFTIDYNSFRYEEICHFEYQYLILNQIPSTFLALVANMQQVDIDNLKVEEIQQGFSEEIVSYAYSEYNFVLLERNGIIHHIQVNKSSKQMNYANYNITLLSEIRNNQYLVSDNDAYYYADNEQFSKFIIQDNGLYQFSYSNWQTLKVNGHFKVLIKDSLVYVINGQHGLYIYTMEDHLLVLKQVLQMIYTDPLKQYNLIDFQFHNEFLYLLDYENGVKRFNLKNMSLDDDFFIHYLGCTTFSILNNTMILISSTQTRSIVVEFKLDQNDWILIRKKILQKQIVKNIKQFNNYAILMSNQYNHVYQKNLLENFTQVDQLKGSNFYQQGFLGFEELDDNYIVGIFKYAVGLYYKLEYPAYLVCQADISQLNTVTVSINSTNCLNKNQSDSLNYCQSRLDYEFDVHGALMSAFQEQIYIYLCLVSAGIATALMAAIFLIYRRYQIKKEKIDLEKQKKLKKSKNKRYN